MRLKSKKILKIKLLKYQLTVFKVEFEIPRLF